jgi:hypothetical protein
MNYKELQNALKSMGATIALNSPKPALQAEYDRLLSSSSASSAIVHSPVHSPSKPSKPIVDDTEVIASCRYTKQVDYVDVWVDISSENDIPVYRQWYIVAEGYQSVLSRPHDSLAPYLGSDVSILGKLTLKISFERNGKVVTKSLSYGEITPYGIDVTDLARCKLNPEQVKKISDFVSKRWCLLSRYQKAKLRLATSNDKQSRQKQMAQSIDCF